MAEIDPEVSRRLQIGIFEDERYHQFEDFISADGIEGNNKILFEEIIRNDPKQRAAVIGTMATYLARHEVDAVTGMPHGGLYLAFELAAHMNVQYVEMEVDKVEDSDGKMTKQFYLNEEQQKLVESVGRVGLVEDVTSTRSTMIKGKNIPILGEKIVAGAVGFRRGRTAGESVQPEDIEHFNNKHSYKPPLEYPLDFPIGYVAEHLLPLTLSGEKSRKFWTQINQPA